MKSVEILKDIHYIGAVDWDRRNFHGYSLSPKGTTYNAFLIQDEKNTVVDTVDASFAGDLLCKIAHVMPVEKVDYIVVNHVEPDHSGALPRLVAACKPEKIVCSVMGEKAIKEYYDAKDWPLHVVKTGDTLSIGKRTLHFMETRMLHWPDSMMTYIPHDKLLISQDAFGQNYATSERFADEVDQAELARQLSRYYANIVLPYSSVTLKILEEVGKQGWDVQMIAPDHGLLWRGAGVGQVIEAYRNFALQKPANKAVVFFDTMWRSTEMMAHAVAQGLSDAGTPVTVMSLKANHHSDVMTEVFESGAVLVGSATHNNGVLPPVSAMLTYMKGLRPQNKVAAAFGSYGWSGESLKLVTEQLTAMHFDVIEGVRAKNRPTHDQLKACVDLGRKVAEALQAKIASF
ncbi:FprA family A-type flavoprotein [Fundidesulfovibrio agrisoli]|uniref:FprA family A-type flavoprotein n=1 Tax=Fundidesulfovibrio agrisoli TaxID=2922717 RepID=UPI001FABD409|nr:flavodoxin domain-containing protein [Fundidesulfovibrio agrisoli]